MHKSMSGTKSPTKSPSKAQQIRQQLEQSVPLDRRLSMMRQDSKVTAQDMDEYKRTELLRKSVNDVKARAQVDAQRRQSPRKTYSGVKSKIAGNMKSQKKAKKNEVRVQQQKQLHQDVLEGRYEVLAVRTSPVRTVSPQKLAEMSPERTAEIQRKQDEINGLKDEFEKRRNETTFKSQTVSAVSRGGVSQQISAQTELRNWSPEKEQPAMQEMTQYTVHEASSVAQGPHQEESDGPARLPQDGQATYKSAYAQDKTHMRKIASAKKKLQSKRTMRTDGASASFVESPNLGATPAGVALDANFGDQSTAQIKSAKSKQASSAAKSVRKQSAAKSKQTATFEQQETVTESVFQTPAPAQKPATRDYPQTTSSPKRAQLAPATTVQGAANMFHNQELEDKIAKVQAEFQALLAAPGAPTRGVRGGAADGLEMDTFYQVMGEFYDNSKNQKHASPTRRLMDQQKASWNHKSHLFKKMKSGEINMQDYSLTYTVDPKRTYVIQPKDGEINYDLAQKSPLKFYDKVMNQDVMEHKVAKKTRSAASAGRPGTLPATKKKTRGFEMTSRLTKRAVARILVAVQDKLQRLISDITNNEHDPADIREALDHPQTKDIVQRHIRGESIKLVDPRQGEKQVFRTQMSLIGERGDRAGNESPDAKAQQRFMQEAGDTLEPEEAQLDANESAIQEVSQTVTHLIRTNSLKQQTASQ